MPETWAIIDLIRLDFLSVLERFAFYAQAAKARTLVQTGDLRKYANVLLRKGVLASD